MGLNILFIMVGITSVIPPAEKTSLICGYKGCAHTFTRDNARVQHWETAHKMKAPEVNFTSCIEGISCIFVSWSQFSQQKGQEVISMPCICPSATTRHVPYARTTMHLNNISHQIQIHYTRNAKSCRHQ